MNFKNLYSQLILDHYNHSPYKGVLMQADIHAQSNNPSCGDVVSIQLQIAHNKLIQAKFQARGCVLSGAAASLLMEHIQGKSLDDCKSMNKDTMLDLIKIPLGPNRLRCVLLVLQAVQTGIMEYKNSGI